MRNLTPIWLCGLALAAGAAEVDPAKRDRDHPDDSTPSTPASAAGSGGGGGTVAISINRSSGGGGGGGGDGKDAEALLLVVVAASAIIGPILLTEDDYSTTAMFPPHPYAPGTPRYLRLTDAPEPLATGRWARWGGRVAVDATATREGVIGGADAAVELPWRLGVAGDWHQVYAAHDRIGALPEAYGGAMATFRFAQASWGEFRIGAGARTVRDSHPTTAPLIAYEVDLFPIHPLVIGLHWDWTRTSTHILSEMRATAGVAWRGAELYGGYGRLRCDDRASEGPIAGLRWWF